ncbi:MAG: MFS transporter [Haloarculaceae archaeon]
MDADRWLVAWALAGVAFGGASLLVPLYVVALGGGATELGVLAGTAALVGAPGALVVGRLADRTGHRRTYLVGSLGLVAAALFVVPVLPGVASVTAANALVWFAAAAAGPVVTLLSTVGAHESEWPGRFGRLNEYHGWGWAGGLSLGTAWVAVGTRLATPLFAQRTFFLACGACATVGTVGAWRWLPADVRRPRPGPVARALSRAQRLGARGTTVPVWPSRLYFATRRLDPRAFVARLTPTLTAYLLAAGLFFTGFAAFFAPLPLFLTGAAGFESGVVFGLYLASSVGSALLYARVGALASRHDPALLQVGGLVLRGALFPAVAAAGLWVAADGVALAAVSGAFLLVGVTWAVIAVTGTTVVTRLAPAASKGEVLGVYAALGAVAGTLGSLLGGVLAESGFLLAFGAAGGLVVTGAACVLGVRWVGRETSVPAVSDERDHNA